MNGISSTEWFTIAGAILFGGCLVFWIPLRPRLARRFSTSESAILGLQALAQFAFAPSMLLCGMLADYVGETTVLFLGSVGVSVSLILLAAADARRLVFAAALALGLSTAAVGIGATLSMPRAFIDNNLPSSLSLGYVFVGFGSLLTISLADLLLERFGTRRVLSLGAVAAIVPAFLAFAADRSTGDPHASQAAPYLATLIDNPSVWLSALLFALFALLEGLLVVWMPTLFVRDLHFDNQGYYRVLVGFWTAYVGARLLLAFARQRWIHDDDLDVWILVSLALAAVIFVGNFVGTSHRRPAALTAVSLGFLLGPIFPMILALLLERTSPREHGTALGIVHALGSVGSWLLGSLLHALSSHRSSLRPALWLLLLVSGSLCVASLAFAVIH
jgi:fucose permease